MRPTLIMTNPCLGMVSISVIALVCSYPLLLEWALPDQLVYWTVSAILRVCSTYSDRVDQAVDALLRFVIQVVQMLPTASREYSKVFKLDITN